MDLWSTLVFLSNPHLLCPKPFHWSRISIVALFISFVQIDCGASHYGFQHCSHFGNCFVSLLLHKKLPLHQQPFYSLLKATFQLSLTILWVGWFSSWFLLGTLKSLAPWLEQLCSGTLGLEDPSFFIWPLSLVALAGWPGLLRAVQSSVKCKT